MIPYYNYFYPMFYPFIPPNCNKPPTLYSVLNSIVNGLKDEDDYTKIRDLAKEGRGVIFNFDYPLSNNIDKEKFETMILNHFLQRRIGFETVTAFRIQLDVKLNEIMPLYNKMFDSLENWNIFNDGEVMTRRGTDNKKSESKNEASNRLENTTETQTENILDSRNSQLPQNEIENVQDGSYLTDYTYNRTNNSGNDNSLSVGTSENKNNSEDETVYNETITRTPADKISILKEMQENIKSIYTLIFKDLDCLFYQLV